MTSLNRSLLLALALTLSAQTAALGQEAAPAEPAAEAPAAPGGDLSMGAPAQPADGPGTTYAGETFGDWQQRCMRTEDGSDPCQLYQLLKDSEGNSVAEFSLFKLPEGNEAVAGATIIVPLETLLTEQLTIAVDNEGAKRYPFTWCGQVGCFARVGFTAEDIDRFKKGAQGVLSIVPVVAPDQRVTVALSLNGFTAGFDSLTPRPGGE